jgi:hypothetical protein
MTAGERAYRMAASTASARSRSSSVSVSSTTATAASPPGIGSETRARVDRVT